MLKLVKFSIPLVAATLFVWSAHAAGPLPAQKLLCDQSLENFNEKTSGSFPEGFTSYEASDLKRVILKGGYYTVTAEHFLSAVAQKQALPIYKNIAKWNLREYPYLRWRWRAKQLPKGGNEKYIRSNDAAAAVYVVWQANALMKVKSIKYTWSSSLNIGEHVSKRFGLDHVLVLQNQNSKLGDWIEETVDVKSAAKKYYEFSEDSLEMPIALAILTDSDATNSVAEADYDDFTLCREMPEAPKPASKSEILKRK